MTSQQRAQDSYPGLFLAFEGLDGCGKTTQIELLEKHLIRRGYDVVMLRAPGGTYAAEELRKVFLDCHRLMHPVTEIAVLQSAINDSYHAIVQPALEAGKIVIADRWTGSTRAYQGGGKCHGDALVMRLAKAILTSRATPERTLYIRTEVQTARARLALRNHKELSSLDKASEDFFFRVLIAYDQIHAPEDTVNGERDIEEIHEDVLRIVNGVVHNWEKTHTLAKIQRDLPLRGMRD